MGIQDLKDLKDLKDLEDLQVTEEVMVQNYQVYIVVLYAYIQHVLKGNFIVTS